MLWNKSRPNLHSDSSSITMGRDKTILIKDTSTKDNKDSKHRKNQNAGSASTRSKASKGSAGQMNQQLTNDDASSPPKSTVNATLLITPDNNRNSPIKVDSGDDSASFSNVSLNGGNTDVGGNDGDAAMDGGGTNNGSSLVPKSGSDST